MQDFLRLQVFLQAKFCFQQAVRLIKAKNHAAAITSLDKTLKCKPDYAAAWSQRGLAQGSLGQHEAAIASFDKALALRPDADWTWHNRGIALGKLGRYFEAVNSFERAIEFNPDSVIAWHNRGITFSDWGRYEAAVASFDRTVKLRPDAYWALTFHVKSWKTDEKRVLAKVHYARYSG